MAAKSLKRSAAAKPTGTLFPYLASYAQQVQDQGYSVSTTQTHVCGLKKLSKWMDTHGVQASAFNENVIANYLAAFRRQGKRANGEAAAAHRCLEQLRVIGVAAPKVFFRDDSPVGKILDRYETYLRVERGLTKSTLINYIPSVRQLLVRRFGKGPIDLHTVTPRDISQFVLRQAPLMAPLRAQLVTTALRSFFRFLLREGEIDADLAASVPKVAAWRLATIPKYIGPKDVQRVVDSSDRNTSIGRRNFAILLLLARFGLRSSEVTALELDDLDWRAGEFSVRGKRTARDRFPLTKEVGAALATYIRRDRPTCTTRRIFIRGIAPWRPLSAPMIGTIVKEAIRTAGVQAPTRGSHLLRHSLATTMLGTGATLAQIGEVLRHRRTRTTEIYAKVDMNGLRSIARPWPLQISAGSLERDMKTMGYPDVDLRALRALATPWPITRS